MALRSIDFRFLVFKKAGTIAVSGVLMLLAFVFMVLCFSQLSGKCVRSCVRAQCTRMVSDRMTPSLYHD